MTDQACKSAAIDRYNKAVIHPTIRSALRHFVHRGGPVDSTRFIATLGDRANFPALSVENVIDAAKAAGLSTTGHFVAVAEIDLVIAPFLALLRRSRAPGAPVDMVQVESVGHEHVVFMRTRFATEAISRAEFNERWSGIVIVTATKDEQPAGDSDLAWYRRQVDVIPKMVTSAECASLIDYCNAVKFEQSRVLSGPHSKATSVIDARIRSSFSAVLPDRDHPILRRLYRTCAAMEGVEESNIELIQCVRYERGQEFKPHFDGGVGLPRLTTFLLYLNDDFTGGDTYFSMLDHSVSARQGACLRFPSCDVEGRILWQSEHGGLPVGSGIKYALNIWVRCPGTASVHGAVHARTPIDVEEHALSSAQR